MLELKEIYWNSLEDEKIALSRINAADTPEIQSQSDKGMLWYYNENIGLADLFLNSDIEAGKQRFYTCARIDEYLIKNYDSRILDYGVNHFTYALLSDNIKLINRYAKLSHPWYSYTIKKGSLTHAIQNIVKEDWQSLEGDIAIYSKLVLSQKGKINIPDLTFFTGMLNKNVSQIKEAIMLLLKDHKKRNRHMGIAQDYISVPALTYTKLAWIQGIEIEIDHPLVPKELLPIQPLDIYEDKYDFLRTK